MSAQAIARWQWLPYLAVALYVAPLLVLGEGAAVRVLDNLDSEVVYRVVVARSPLLFSSDPHAVLPQLMGGVPRGCLPSGFQLGTALYAVLPPFWAYVLLECAARLVAVAGIALLLRKHVLAAPADPRVVAFGAAAFGCLAYPSVFGLTVAGQPLLLCAWLALRAGTGRWWHVGLFAAWPLWASAVLVAPFLVTILGGAWLVDRHKGRQNRAGLVALLLFCGMTVLVELPVLRLMASGFQSHRGHWDPVALAAMGENPLLQAWTLLWRGHVHVAGTTPWAWLVALAVAVPMAKLQPVQRMWLLRAALALLAMAVWFLVWRLPWVATLRSQFVPLRAFQGDRFYLFCGVASAIAAFVAIAALLASPLRRLRCAGWALAIASLAELFAQSPAWRGVCDHGWAALQGRDEPVLSWRRFFAEPAMQAVRLAANGARIANVGIHPAVAWYNDIATADGYLNNYPLAYKQRFRRAMATELARNPTNLRYFDAWGSRAYLFTAQTGPKIGRADFDTPALCALGVRVLCSAGHIGNANALEWRLESERSDGPGGGQLVVYRLDCTAK